MTGGAFKVAHAAAGHWGGAAKSCLNSLGDTVGANIGFLYATETLADDLPSILTFLRETTHIEHWVGAAAPGLCADDSEYREGGALAVMVGTLPEGSFQCFSGADGGAGEGVALVHADPADPRVVERIATLAARCPTVVGGLVSPGETPSQIAGGLAGGVSGLRLGPGVAVITGMTQGCTPIGAVHTVTKAESNTVMTLDGEPALDVLKADAGELIARDLRRAAGYIHLALPEDEGTGYLVRSLMGVDTRRNWLAVADYLEEGRQAMFVRRDANTAQADLHRMLNEIRAKLDGRAPVAAIYTSCVARGSHMFGSPGAETAAIREALGDVPLIGFLANGEIAAGRIHSYTGVLAVIAGERK